MENIKDYIKLIRPKHYLKNGLIFVPLFFNMSIFSGTPFLKALLGFIVFSLMSSIIYIINDINDIEADRKSEFKKNRPLASGKIEISHAIFLAIILMVIITFIVIYMKGQGCIWLILYFVLNLIYSFKLKHYPIVDVAILASGFLLRLLYGATITNLEISFWLCMTVVAFSFYMGLGKRRKELEKNGDNANEVRGVLRYYNSSFLDKNMYMCLGLAITFYALWSGADSTITRLGTDMQIWTVPLVIIIAMKYSLDIEKGESGDPMEVILEDKLLIAMVVIYVLLLFIIMYIL